MNQRLSEDQFYESGENEWYDDEEKEILDKGEKPKNSVPPKEERESEGNENYPENKGERLNDKRKKHIPFEKPGPCR